ALRAFGCDLLEFRVERIKTARPVDVVVDRGKEEGQKRPEIDVEGFLPRTVEVRHGLLLVGRGKGRVAAKSIAREPETAERKSATATRRRTDRPLVAEGHAGGD